ncbi:hypothetical protein Tco_1243028, partial [Tanacetum coccineum]
TDISEITRKRSKSGKHGHEKRKSTREAKDAKPKPGKVKKSKLIDNSGGIVHNGRVKNVISRHLIGHSSNQSHVANEESTRNVGIYTNLSLKRSTRESQTDCHAGNPCELNCDPTDEITPSMISK